MAESRQRQEWDRTSSILALLYNINRDHAKTKAALPDDFNPFRKHVEKAVRVNKDEAIEIFKAIADSFKR